VVPASLFHASRFQTTQIISSEVAEHERHPVSSISVVWRSIRNRPRDRVNYFVLDGSVDTAGMLWKSASREGF